MNMIDSFIQHGVTKFCIAPGSRSTPLALAVADHPKADLTVHYDERGLAFYALGHSMATKKPTVVITTSGTAVANLYPAVMEAYHSHVPLILLTADRPHELRNCGANQATDQLKIFNNCIVAQAELSPHLDDHAIHSIIAQHVNTKGPVHINCPFQEPLIRPNIISNLPPISFFAPHLVAKPFHIKAKRGVILLGKSDPIPVLELAKRLQWPVFADILSQARCTPTSEQIRHFDLIKTDLQPDFLLHFGERFISKNILEWAKDIPMAHVSPFPTLQDPIRRLSVRIQSDIAPFCETFSAFTDPQWLPAWKELDDAMAQHLNSHFDSPFTEAHAIRNLPSDRPIFFGNSMPIRLADQFYFPNKAPLIFANRGMSGIDGNIATIAGLADGFNTPLFAFIGDQTALHDLNSLPLLKKHPTLLIISNNYGGAIFDHLSVSQSPHLDRLFTASHSWSFENSAKMFNIPYIKKEKNLNELPTSGIVELITDRKENYIFINNTKPIGLFCNLQKIESNGKRANLEPNGVLQFPQ
ncbi:MAG TPA: 2-succinyl-5-enolpyruvyl-6-hydroxy-3-cyclohexene-1-carboxylic-acid synthase [Chlamydiales bacterium]|nr:2-succinyl-5-enolpyruvyl-6-hydroxy-3-cyclohexene-1-carboxylic-acid synthase [Chlamydiales bacterium]